MLDSVLYVSHIWCLSACPIAADTVHFEPLPWGCHEHITLSILLSSWKLLFWGEPPSKNCLGPALLSFWDEAVRVVWGEFFSILANLLLRFSLLEAFHVYSWALFILKIICACVDVCVRVSLCPCVFSSTLFKAFLLLSFEGLPQCLTVVFSCVWWLWWHSRWLGWSSSVNL